MYGYFFLCVCNVVCDCGVVVFFLLVLVCFFCVCYSLFFRIFSLVTLVNWENQIVALLFRADFTILTRNDTIFFSFVNTLTKTNCKHKRINNTYNTNIYINIYHEMAHNSASMEQIDQKSINFPWMKCYRNPFFFFLKSIKIIRIAIDVNWKQTGWSQLKTIWNCLLNVLHKNNCSGCIAVATFW